MDGRSAALVGRDGELAALSACLDRALAGEGELVLVTGEPGIGKTRLLEEAARAAGERGFLVAWGRAWEVGGAPAYWPWIEALRGLGRVMPEVAKTERFALFDGVAELVREAAAARPTLIVLDDLHAADPSSLQMLELVVRHLRDARAVIVGSHRDVEARSRPEVDASLSRLRRAATVIEPLRLTMTEVGALVRNVTGKDDDDTTRIIHETSEGNPLFARELLRLLHARGQAAPGAARVPEGVRAVIRQRLALLSPATVALLGAAAAVGREFAIAVAAEVAGVTADALAETLAEAEQADLIADAGRGRWRFSHVLVAETLVHDLPVPSRARLHRRAAETLERLHAGDAAAPLDEIAHHWLEAGADAAGRAVDAAGRAAARALERLAFEAAAALDERALAALAVAAPGDGRRKAELLLALGEARLRAGDREAGQRACREATEVARALHAGDLLARAALTLGVELSPGQIDRGLVALLEEALAVLPAGDSALRARAMARLAGALQPAPDPSGPVAMAREAIAMARRLGDPEVLLAVLHAAMGALMDYAPPAERAAINEEVVQRATAAGDRPVALRARLRLAFDRLELVDLPGFDAAVEGFAAAAGEFRQPRYHWSALLFRSARALWQGRFDEAGALEEQARHIAERAQDVGVLIAHRYRQPFLARLRGDVPELEASLGRLLEMVGHMPQARVVIASWAAVLTGRAADARRELAVLTPESLAAIAHDPNGSAILAEVATALGAREMAEVLYPVMLPRAGLAVVATGVGFFLQDLADRSLLLFATLLEHWDDADRHARSGLAVAARLGARALGAQLGVDWGASLIARGGAEAKAQAQLVLADALGEAEALGLAPLAARARELRDPVARPAPTEAVTIVHEGEYATISGAGEICRLKDSRGVRMLAQLVAEPGRELSALDLSGPAGEPVDAGDAGETLDREARAAYQARLVEVREELEEARAWNDVARAARLEAEAEALAGELAGAVGLGGRQRRTGRASERARVNVQRRLADTLRRIAEAAPALGRHLLATVRTGTFCVYQPEQPRPR